MASPTEAPSAGRLSLILNELLHQAGQHNNGLLNRLPRSRRCRAFAGSFLAASKLRAFSQHGLSDSSWVITEARAPFCIKAPSSRNSPAVTKAARTMAGSKPATSLARPGGAGIPSIEPAPAPGLGFASTFAFAAAFERAGSGRSFGRATTVN